MSPNLVLLIDQTNDSSLNQLGPLLFKKLQDNHWEIRNGALQVLITISELSHSSKKKNDQKLYLHPLIYFFFFLEFFSFQDLLHKEKFSGLVLKLCEEDTQSVVRASALKCLQHMVKANILWDEFFKEQNLLVGTKKKSVYTTFLMRFFFYRK